MAFIDKTMFEVTVSNSVRNQTQNVPGKFGTNTGASFVAADCSAGTLCVQNGLIPSEGYEAIPSGGSTVSILNGNTWYYNVAADGTKGMLGDHTGIYAFNNYDVNKVGSGDLQFNLGAKTLGVGLPAGNRGDFCEIIIGEQYTFGLGNFSTAPSAGVSTGYATIDDGFLVYSASAPAAGSGVYFEILRTKNMNEGTSYWGKGYVLRALRAEAAAE
ncbi:MAG: hypothetical protein KBS59_04030 [Clostridiales bacterium]|nr:hypothetical protein [Clostridiales bacterium]